MKLKLLRLPILLSLVLLASCSKDDSRPSRYSLIADKMVNDAKIEISTGSDADTWVESEKVHMDGNDYSIAKDNQGNYFLDVNVTVWLGNLLAQQPHPSLCPSQ